MRQHDEAALAVGKQMIALRPQLDYKSSTPVSVVAD
jgi:transcriptional regulator